MLYTSELRRFLFLALAVLVASCVSQNDSTGDNERPRLAANSWRISDTPLLTINSSSSDTSAAISKIVNVLRTTNGNIAIGDATTNSAKVYDSRGRFVRSIGRSGDGPNELRNLRTVLRYGDNRLLLSDARGRVVVFDSTGTPVSSITLSIPDGVVQALFRDSSFFARRDAERQVFPGGPSGARINPGYRYLVTREGVPLDTLGPFTLVKMVGGAGYFFSELVFGPTTSFAVDGENYYVANSGNYEVAVYARDGTLLRSVRRHWSPTSVSDAEISEFIEAKVANAEPQYQQALRRVLNPDFFNRQLPAFEGIAIDSEGYLWVESYDMDRDLPRAVQRDTVSRTKPWSIFDSKGVWECDVLLPRDLAVTDIGRDYVLGFRLDRDDVPEVVLYRLVRARSARSS